MSLDAAGNVTAAHGLNFVWTQAGQLKSIRQGSTLLAAYFYDFKGRRSRKVVYLGTWGVTTIYAYDRYDRLTAELGATGTPLRTYVWRDDVPVAIISHLPDGTAPTVYLETDHLGTPIVARDAAGTVVWRWESDAFGTTPPNEDPDGDGVRTTINLRFPGQYFDRESGLHYNWHRYYDPTLGRYLSPDPIGIAGGTNLYSYVGGNPLKYKDPRGLERTVGDILGPDYKDAPRPSGWPQSANFAPPGGGAGDGAGDGSSGGGRSRDECIKRCWKILERPKKCPGDDSPTWDFQKCVNRCMGLE